MRPRRETAGSSSLKSCPRGSSNSSISEFVRGRGVPDGFRPVVGIGGADYPRHGHRVRRFVVPRIPDAGRDAELIGHVEADIGVGRFAVVLRNN